MLGETLALAPVPAMEMLRRNLKRQASCSLSAFAGAASPRAADQENLQPNLASPPPASPAKGASSPRPKQPAAAAAAPPAATVEEDRSTAATTAPADDEPSVKVVVRVRPTVSRPLDGKDLWFVRKTTPDSLAVGDRSFPVDGALDDRASQADAFDMVGLPMIDKALAGFNTSLVCYGQSGTAKTYTMWGPRGAMVDSGSDHADLGNVPRVFQNLFSRIQRMRKSSPDKQTSYQCRCSFLEVHNEQINYLLEPSQCDLQIKENAGNGIHVENLPDEYVSIVEDINQILMKVEYPIADVLINASAGSLPICDSGGHCFGCKNNGSPDMQHPVEADAYTDCHLDGYLPFDFDALSSSDDDDGEYEHLYKHEDGEEEFEPVVPPQVGARSMGLLAFN